MYDRAARALTVLVGNTDPHLGPGYYELLPRTSNEPRKGGFAPFLSLTSRGLGSISQKDESDVPGPGHYDIDKAQKIIKGGKSPQYKEKRFREIRADTPGPGTYCQPPSIGLEVSWAKRTSKVPAAQRLAGRIKTLRKSEAPSIPARGQGYGYEETEDGTLVKHIPPATDNTLGPAYYKTENNTYSTMRYKGVHFGNLTEKRYEFKVLEGPGPADYDVAQERAVHYENVNIKREDQKKYDLHIPRYPEVIVLQEEKKGVPGPGKYDIKSQFRKAADAAQTETQHAPFLSLAQRFAPVKSSTPAPGTYNETRCALESLKKASKSKNIPFGHTSVRFTQDYRCHKTPGPAFYNILNYGITTQSLKSAVVERRKKGAFGSSVPRLLYLVKREAFTTPGPADYQTKETTKKPRKRQKQLSVFVSATERIPVVSSEAPAPGSYDVHKSYEKSQGKTEYMPPRTTVAKRKHTSFLSGTFRRGFSKTDMDMPGPATYNIEVHKPGPKTSTSLTVWVSQVERFKETKEETPGPGTYELSPLLRDTVLKRTYNTTLNNPVEIQMNNAVCKPVTGRRDLLCVSNELALKVQNEALVPVKSESLLKEMSTV
ncbi:sperm-tail PG-rich repeat-containing protein 2 [Hemicordylus capensis]|uniref:sperm-tail PG-rich repeat-containing protein 2 n=1 Tax=Hemicordylus capensis TaxID=884348 RepID=UPI0023027B5A|nr:sperm-tail PG-rich repeat-containing protein 2 [Hemicordylus capensis]